MRRALVLTNEAARHPFRAMLPPPVFARSARSLVPERMVSWWRQIGLPRAELRLLALVYVGGFAGTLAFVS